MGVSTGITYDLPANAQWVLMTLMFTGRIGTITVASAPAMVEKAVASGISASATTSPPG